MFNAEDVQSEPLTAAEEKELFDTRKELEVRMYTRSFFSSCWLHITARITA